MFDKHFLNTPETLVVDSLKGLAAVNPNARLDAGYKVLHQVNPDRSKVAIICGGGAGHEPAHAGYVGDGMLNAAVCGNVFASPNASQVRRGIELVDNDAGTLIIVTNYTGDVLNFGLAKENYAALHPDKTNKIKFLIVGDDVSVGRTQGSVVGRRGLAGVTLVCKVAGTLSRRGSSLDQVYSVAHWVSTRLATIGVGLEHCHVPGTNPSNSHLSAYAVEIGMGIHNETGHRTFTVMPPLREFVGQLSELLTSITDPERSFLPFVHDGNDEVVLLVNNLGGTSELELGAIVNEAICSLERKVRVRRTLFGTFMTSLNMPGFSLTLLLLPRANETSAPQITEILSLIDEPTNAPGWKWSSHAPTQGADQALVFASEAAELQLTSEFKVATEDPQMFVNVLKRACESLVRAEPEITHMDTIAGDGDCGLTLRAGAEGVLKELNNGRINGTDIVSATLAIAKQAEIQMGGTSGALYSIFFSSLAQELVIAARAQNSSVVNTKIWTSALDKTLNRLYSYTRARPPSRTLVDPLDAFVKMMQLSDFPTAVKAAANAAEATRNLEAKVGRSAYVAGDILKREKIPDPGAWGVKVILESML